MFYLSLATSLEIIVGKCELARVPVSFHLGWGWSSVFPCQCSRSGRSFSFLVTMPKTALDAKTALAFTRLCCTPPGSLEWRTFFYFGAVTTGTARGWCGNSNYRPAVSSSGFTRAASAGRFLLTIELLTSKAEDTFDRLTIAAFTCTAVTGYASTVQRVFRAQAGWQGKGNRLLLFCLQVGVSLCSYRKGEKMFRFCRDCLHHTSCQLHNILRLAFRSNMVGNDHV